MNRTMKKLLVVCAVTALLACAQQSMAESIAAADYTAEFTGAPAATGWSYLWNPSGYQIGDSAHYQSLQYGTVESTPAYTVTSGLWGGTAPDGDGKYVVLGNGWGAWPYVHPGLGSTQSSDGYDHAPIAAYTIQSGEAGACSIINSGVRRYAGNDSGSVSIFVYVNDALVKTVSGVVDSSYGGTSFDCDLGNLKVNDTVYVCLSPNGSNNNDPADFKFQLSSTVPEPTTLSLLGGGGLLGLIAYAWRRRKS